MKTAAYKDRTAPRNGNANLKSLQPTPNQTYRGLCSRLDGNAIWSQHSTKNKLLQDKQAVKYTQSAPPPCKERSHIIFGILSQVCYSALTTIHPKKTVQRKAIPNSRHRCLSLPSPSFLRKLNKIIIPAVLHKVRNLTLHFSTWTTIYIHSSIQCHIHLMIPSKCAGVFRINYHHSLIQFIPS